MITAILLVSCKSFIFTMFGLLSLPLTFFTIKSFNYFTARCPFAFFIAASLHCHRADGACIQYTIFYVGFFILASTYRLIMKAIIIIDHAPFI